MVTADLGGPRRKRRWVKFSLRSFFVGVGVVAVWLGWCVNSATRQQQAVRAILARNGTIEYDYQYDADRHRRLPQGKPSYPDWLQRLLGDDYFHDVVMVGLDVDEAGHGVEPTDADLVHLKGLRHLKLLYLDGGHITDDGLKHLQNLTELRMLVLGINPIKGEGLKHLSRLRNLQHLDLSRTQVTDDHLISLKNLIGLERIDLPGNPQLSGSFLEHVADLPHLKELVLRRSGVTDSALVHLQGAKKLQVLMLDGTQVTDAGIVHLRGLTSLRSLDLSATAVSQVTVEEIEKWLPQASVKRTKPKQSP